MRKNAVARRYAKALFQLAKEQGSLEQVASDLQLISRFLEDPQLKELLEDRRISSRRKKEMARELWGKYVSMTVLAFVDLLFDKQRERILDTIIDVFKELLLAEKNIAVADVKTAFPLDAEAEEQLRQALERYFKKKIELRVSVVPELIGGVVVKVGDRVFDGSVAKRLALMEEHLAAGRS
ncbi:MAG: F0F1 ATP synthase subunit delta [Thermacetogeniaceae bacterium]